MSKDSPVSETRAPVESNVPVAQTGERSQQGTEVGSLPAASRPQVAEVAGATPVRDSTSLPSAARPPTPRTDEWEREREFKSIGVGRVNFADPYFELLAFARQLERELAAETKLSNEMIAERDQAKALRSSEPAKLSDERIDEIALMARNPNRDKVRRLLRMAADEATAAAARSAIESPALPEGVHWMRCTECKSTCRSDSLAYRVCDGGTRSCNFESVADSDRGTPHG